MTIDDMRDKVRMLFAGAGRDGAIDALARRINHNLMLFDDRLYDLGTGQSVAVSDNVIHGADSIAEAVAALLEGRRSDADCVQLLLPPAEFMAQTIRLPGLSKADVRAALKLQIATRLPEQEQNLDVCLTFNPCPGHEFESIVWWLPSARADQLFEAMASRSIFMAAVMPRPAWLLASLLTRGASTTMIADTDSAMQTVVGLTTAQSADGADLQLFCLQTATSDLQDQDIANVWQSELAQSGLTDAEPQLNSAEDYLRYIRGHNLQVFDPRVSLTANFPDGALAARHQLDRGRRRTLVLKAAAAVAAIMMLPGLYQTWQLTALNAELAELRQASAVPREDQGAVRDFESQWGVLTEFPQQDVIEVMLSLQEVINPGVLSAFSINEGVISIEGESQDPQNVLEILEQNPLFTEVDFARATNNNRYFIDLRLATVNFPAYQEWHFPGQR